MACEIAPVSRTHQYRKVMKPMLERKRRARMTKCLDELKDLMVNVLGTEMESIAKMEKADILQVTVNHMKTLQHRGQLSVKPQPIFQEKYREGYTRCASEVSRCLASIEGVDVTLGTKLMTRLGVRLTENENTGPLTIMVPQSAMSPASTGYCTPEMSPSQLPNFSRSPVLPTSMNGLLTFARHNHSQNTTANITEDRNQRCKSVNSNNSAVLASPTANKPVWRPW